MELGAKVAAHRKVLILSGGLQSPHVGDSFLFTSTRFPCPTNTYTRNLCTDPLHQPGVTEAKQALPLAVFISRLLEGVVGTGPLLLTQQQRARLPVRGTRLRPWVGKIPGGGHGSQLRYPCLGNPMGCGPPGSSVHGVAESDVT